MDAVIRWHKESPKNPFSIPVSSDEYFHSSRFGWSRSKHPKSKNLIRLWSSLVFDFLKMYLFIFCSIVLDKSVAFGWCFWISFIIIFFFLWGYYLMEADEREDARRARVMWPAPRHRHAGESCPTFGAKEQLKQSSSSTPPRALVTLLFLCPLLPLLPPPLHLKMKKVSSTLHTVAWDDISIVCFSWFIQ